MQLVLRPLRIRGAGLARTLAGGCEDQRGPAPCPPRPAPPRGRAHCCPENGLWSMSAASAEPCSPRPVAPSPRRPGAPSRPCLLVLPAPGPGRGSASVCGRHARAPSGRWALDLTHGVVFPLKALRGSYLRVTDLAPSCSFVPLGQEWPGARGSVPGCGRDQLL